MDWSNLLLLVEHVNTLKTFSGNKGPEGGESGSV